MAADEKLQLDSLVKNRLRELSAILDIPVERLAIQCLAHTVLGDCGAVNMFFVEVRSFPVLPYSTPADNERQLVELNVRCRLPEYLCRLRGSHRGVLPNGKRMDWGRDTCRSLLE